MIKETSRETIESIYSQQKDFFNSFKTRDVNFRLQMLKAFRAAILKYEKRISDALYADLRKSPQEAYLTEISIVIQELDLHIAKIKKWSKPKRVPTPFYLLPSSSRVIYEPLGLSLIIAPWNYPFQLQMNPLVGAISSGCCAILKPSPDTPATAKVMEELVAETFPPEYISVIQGGRETNERLLKHRFDLIFFTGSTTVGKVIMKAAAEHLTPVVLELGGKSPCIVDRDADIPTAARRIAWGKLINAGQTCIAPDYILAHEDVKEDLIKELIRNMETMYGSDFKNSDFYPRIVNERAFDRLSALLNDGKVRYGGITDKADRFISPSILDEVSPDAPVMQEEIFGPILPVLTFNQAEEVISFVNQREKPLAFYYFGKNAKAREILSKTTSGGGCINDTLAHIINHNLPFGGVGNSGTGSYHGYNSFLAFSHKRAIVKSATWIDLPVKYVPFKGFNLIRKLL